MSIKLNLTILLFCGICLSSLAQDDIYELGIEALAEKNLKRPIILGFPHPHNKGEGMISYSYMFMPMDQNLIGSSEVDNSTILSDFTATPINMDMKMHMLMGMFTPVDRITVMLMMTYNESKMDHVTRSGGSFTAESSSFGDMLFKISYTFINKDKNVLLGNLGLSIPTGSIDETGINPMSNGNAVQLPYPMQQGSGTFDPILSITYLSIWDKFSLGIDLSEKVRLGENSNDYKLGNEFMFMVGGVYYFSKQLGFTSRFDVKKWGNIEGSDPNLNPMVVPTARVDLRGGERIDTSIGLLFEPHSGFFRSQQFAFDFRKPIYQNLDGPQLRVQHHYMISWAYTFGKNTLYH